MNKFSLRSIIKRPRIKQEKTFEQRLAEEAARFKQLADQTPHGTQRALYLRRARQAETASHINEWLTSPGLRPPTELKNLKTQNSRE
jgi:hypothetical protein